MANLHANPTKARLVQKSYRKPGDLQALQRCNLPTAGSFRTR